MSPYYGANVGVKHGHEDTSSNNHYIEHKDMEEPERTERHSSCQIKKQCDLARMFHSYGMCQCQGDKPLYTYDVLPMKVSVIVLISRPKTQNPAC